MKTNRWLSLLRKCVKRSGDPTKRRKQVRVALLVIAMLKKDNDKLKEENNKLNNALAKTNGRYDEKPIKYRV